MNKPRTIWVPWIRMMQHPHPSSDDLVTLMVALDQGLHHVGPRIEGLFSLLEFHTGQRRSVLAIIMVSLLCVYVVTGKRAPLACNIVVYLVAAYCSFHNIEHSSKHDDCQWIIFWMIFGLFNIADYYTNEIREYFPIFWLFKLLFLTWCLAPMKNNGVATVYLHLLYPTFLGTDDSVDFIGCRAFCNRLFSSCDAWSAQKAIEGPHHGHGATNAGESTGAHTKPAGDGTNKRSSVSSLAPAGAPTQKNLRRASASSKGGAGRAKDGSAPPSRKNLFPPPHKFASDSLFKSRTGTLDEHTYESHLSQPRHAAKGEAPRKSKGEAGASSWNDVSFLSRGASQPDDAQRSSSTQAAASKDSIPLIQPVIQPLFSLYSSPYSSAHGSSYPTSFSTQPSTAPYAFGPSYPSYHTRPFYRGCLPGYGRPRSLLYSGALQRRPSFTAERRLSGEYSDLDSFNSKRRDDNEGDEETCKDARSTRGASAKGGKKANGENKDKRKAEGGEKGKEGKGKGGVGKQKKSE